MTTTKLLMGQLACMDCGQAVESPNPATIEERIAEYRVLMINGRPGPTVQPPMPIVTQLTYCVECADTARRSRELWERYPAVVKPLGWDGYGVALIEGALVALDALGVNAQGIADAVADDRRFKLTLDYLGRIGAGLKWLQLIGPVLQVDPASCAEFRWSHLEDAQIELAREAYLALLQARVDGPRYVEPPSDGPRGCMLCGIGGVTVMMSKSFGVWGSKFEVHDLAVLGGRSQADVVAGYACPECRTEINQYGIGPTAAEASLINSMRLQTKIVGVEFPGLQAWIALPGNPRPNDRRWGHVLDLDKLKADIEKASEGRLFIGDDR